MTAEQDRLVTENIGLVHACARRYIGRGIDYDDLYQSGCEGLVKAAAGYDASRGVRFSTYAVPAILGEIRRLFRDGGSVKISRSLKELSVRVSRAAEELALFSGREPTVSELSEKLNITPEQTAEALNALQRPLSLTMTEDDSQADIPTEPPDEKITERLALYSELQKLPEPDRELIKLRYFRGFTQSKTASLLGMTQVQVSRREKKLLLLLRQRLL